MQSLPYTGHFLPQILHVVSSFFGISLGTSSNLISSMIPPIMTNIPPLVCEAPLLVASGDTRTQSSEESLVRYNLRNRAIPNMGNMEGSVRLGNLRMLPTPKKRGRKSHLNLAQARAKQDIATGKQTSIIQALRAWDALAGVSP